MEKYTFVEAGKSLARQYRNFVPRLDFRKVLSSSGTPSGQLGLAISAEFIEAQGETSKPRVKYARVRNSHSNYEKLKTKNEWFLISGFSFVAE